MRATRSGTASMACSARSAIFKATATKLERVTFLDKLMLIDEGKAAAVAEAPANEQSGPDAIVEQRGHTLIVTLNRPHARNALSTEMMEIMVQAWDRVDNDDDIRCCILTGAGGYFCAGMDLKAATKKPPGESFKDGSYDPSRIDALLKGRRLTKPLIAAVEGPAIAGGTEILQGTDIRIAGESAKFGISEAKWSLYPMGGSAVRLVRQIPYTVAADLLLTGRHISAAEAKEIGFFGRVRADGDAAAKGLQVAGGAREKRATGGMGAL